MKRRQKESIHSHLPATPENCMYESRLLWLQMTETQLKPVKTKREMCWLRIQGIKLYLGASTRVLILSSFSTVRNSFL